MAATPKTGIFSFIGLQSGRTYNVSAYCSDVAAAKVLLSQRGLATTTSDNFWKTPEDVRLVDWTITAGLVDTNVLSITVDDSIVSGAILEKTAHVNTSPTRPLINMNIRKGTNFGAIQS